MTGSNDSGGNEHPPGVRGRRRPRLGPPLRSGQWKAAGEPQPRQPRRDGFVISRDRGPPTQTWKAWCSGCCRAGGGRGAPGHPASGVVGRCLGSAWMCRGSVSGVVAGDRVDHPDVEIRRAQDDAGSGVGPTDSDGGGPAFGREFLGLRRSERTSCLPVLDHQPTRGGWTRLGGGAVRLGRPGRRRAGVRLIARWRPPTGPTNVVRANGPSLRAGPSATRPPTSALL